jgi:hypothetical protein
MTVIVLAKSPSGAMVPVDTETVTYISKLRLGAVIHGNFARMRNPRFHRKAFALFGFAFDLWDAPQLEYKGQQVAKNFDRFRKDITILAGHYEAVMNLRGDVRLEPKSLSFGNMGEDEFETVYKSVLGVMWDRVLKDKGYATLGSVDNVIDNLLRFE